MSLTFRYADLYSDGYADEKDGQVRPFSMQRRLRDPAKDAIECGGGRTKQEFREECDINVLMKRYERTGVPPSARIGNPTYVDAADLPSYMEALQLVRDAHENFEALPARVRAEFQNDPQAFVQFASDPANKEKLREWGLGAPVEAPPAPLEVRVVNEPAGDGGSQ